MEKIEISEINLPKYSQIYLTKEQRQCKGTKTASLKNWMSKCKKKSKHRFYTLYTLHKM